MKFLRSSLTRHAETTNLKLVNRSLANSALAKRAPPPPPPFPVIPTCPSPTCRCSSTPPDLDIDRARDLNGTMSPYAQHLLVSTGRKDWTSKIENERDTAPWGRFTWEMKAILGRGSEFHDPYNNILISTSSFTPWEQQGTLDDANASDAEQSSFEMDSVDALLFPAFKHIRPLASSTASTATSKTENPFLKDFTRAFLLPKRLHPIYDGISDSDRRAKTRDPELADKLPINIDDIRTATILICSHGQRDSRCGILGPLLHSELREYINNRTPNGLDDTRNYAARVQKFTATEEEASATPSKEEESSTSDPAATPVPINVGTISHVGGHKWAGNVIIYIPPNATAAATTAGAGRHRHPLAGKGIWYGRVEPRHVQGIVEETVLRGQVIRDLFRGGIGEDGSVIRL